MNKTIFDQIEVLQKSHWYHVGTKEFIQEYVVRNVGTAKLDRWLDVGCGGGGLLTSKRIQPRRLRVGLEYSELALPHWNGSFSGVRGDAQSLPFADSSFDLVSAFDVIEHLPSDRLGLSEIYRVLAPGGSFLMIVPCHQLLWSSVDEELGHYRRYVPEQAVNLVRDIFGGVEPVEIRHMNSSLFFPVYVLRRLQNMGLLRSADKEVGSASMPPNWLNSMLLAAFRVELRYLSPRAPVGIGLFLHIRKAK